MFLRNHLIDIGGRPVPSPFPYQANGSITSLGYQPVLAYSPLHLRLSNCEKLGKLSGSIVKVRLFALN